MEDLVFPKVRWLKPPRWYGQLKADSGEMTIRSGSFEFKGREYRLASSELSGVTIEVVRVRVDGSIEVTARSATGEQTVITTTWFGFLVPGSVLVPINRLGLALQRAFGFANEFERVLADLIGNERAADIARELGGEILSLPVMRRRGTVAAEAVAAIAQHQGSNASANAIAAEFVQRTLDLLSKGIDLG